MSETLVVGGGCFWCLEAVFEQVDGVSDVVSGYAGGRLPNPDYEAVCGGSTGHAEVVRITFDPVRISIDGLLDLFWRCHNPTTLNRQGADVGTHYRSIILYADEQQKEAALASRLRVQKELESPIVTEIVPLREFWPAEEYHQDYYRRNPSAGYCQMVIRPKLKKLVSG